MRKLLNFDFVEHGVIFIFNSDSLFKCCRNSRCCVILGLLPNRVNKTLVARPLSREFDRYRFPVADSVLE